MRVYEWSLKNHLHDCICFFFFIWFGFLHWYTVRQQSEEEDDHGDGVPEEAEEDDEERDGGVVEAEVAQVSSDPDHGVVVGVGAGEG